MPISNRNTPKPAPDMEQLRNRYRANAEREAKATAKLTEQRKVQFHATYERAVDKGELKPLNQKRSAEMDSLWQSLGGLRENIGGDSGPYKVLTDYNGELFVRTQSRKPGSRPTWESAGPLLDANAAKGWVK